MLIADQIQSLSNAFIMPRPQWNTAHRASWLCKLAGIALLSIAVFITILYALLNTQLQYPQTETPPDAAAVGLRHWDLTTKQIAMMMIGWSQGRSRISHYYDLQETLEQCMCEDLDELDYR